MIYKRYVLLRNSRNLSGQVNCQVTWQSRRILSPFACPIIILGGITILIKFTYLLHLALGHTVYLYTCMLYDSVEIIKNVQKKPGLTTYIDSGKDITGGFTFYS